MPEDSSQEKTEDATPKRLREARKKGQVSRSRDLNTIVIMIAAFALLAAMMPFMQKEFTGLMKGSFDFAGMGDVEPQRVITYLKSACKSFAFIILPFGAVLALVALLVSFLQTGPIFSLEPLTPQFKRINFIENAKNMFKMQTFIELIKNIVKIFLIFYIAYCVIKGNLDQILLSASADLTQSTLIAGHIVTAFLIRVFVLFALIAIADVMVQRWQYKKQLRMTKEEVKREYKQDEGDPIIKSARKQMHQELAMGDTKQAVAASDVVITNPTKLAVAVKYNDKEMMAPHITTKGQRLFAQKIREFAEEEGIPIIQNVPLAWALIDIDVGEEVPEELYQAVAEILVVVYRLKEEKEKKNPRS